jgi:hypothetical protein
MPPKLRIGISPSLLEYFPDDIPVGPGIITPVDLSIVLRSDDGPWVTRAYRRLRPHFVNSIEDARLVHAAYKELDGKSTFC